MKQLNIFIELTRLNRPTGFMLLFWPCSWGLVFAYQYNQDIKKLLYFLLLFFLGSVLMRSAGCIVNDIVDKNIDTKVKRTKNRPLASGKISVRNSALYVLILCIFAFIILIQFNKLTILLGLASMFLAFSYPFMLSITYWPQLFLGLTFNWGIIMAWTSMGNVISTEIMLLYLAAIFWTLGYDTIYGAQDITEDEIIGVKSTSIKFKDNIKMFVALCYLISSIILIFLFHNQMHLYYFIVPMFLFIVSLGYQIKIFDTKIPIKCLHAFKINNFSGVFLFLSILGSSNKINIL